MSISNNPSIFQNNFPSPLFQLSHEYILDNYRGSSKYCLQLINSLFYKDGKFYNMLEKMSPMRRLRCGCVKSNCDAKYCQCFRLNAACGESCSCIGCKNRKVRVSNMKSDNLASTDVSCNCKKSGCLKKYCECFQNGKKCSSKCCCCECGNAEDDI